MADESKRLEYKIRLLPANGLEPEGIVGVIEYVGNGEKRVFISLDDLYNILIDFEGDGKKDSAESYFNWLKRAIK